VSFYEAAREVLKIGLRLKQTTLTKFNRVKLVQVRETWLLLQITLAKGPLEELLQC